MSISFSTEGRVAFRVTVSPTPINLGRFAQAVFQTSARVSHAKKVSPRSWQAIVWLKAAKIPQFENLCSPVEFQFVSTRSLARNQIKDPPSESV